MVSLLSRDWGRVLFQAIEDESNGRGMGYGMGSGGAMKCARGVPMAFGAIGAPGGADVPIAMRTNFAALACVHADVRTDAAGACTVPVSLPDSLMKYHVIAVACTAQSVFGVGEGAVEVALPLTVCPALPQF